MSCKVYINCKMIGSVFLIISAHLSFGIIADEGKRVATCDHYNKSKCETKDLPCHYNESLLNVCEDPSFTECFVTWRNNSGKVEITLKGCIKDVLCDKPECISYQSVASVSGKRKELYCCCSGDNCNLNFDWIPGPDPTPQPKPRVKQGNYIELVIWICGSLLFLAVIVSVVFYYYRRNKMENFGELPTIDTTNFIPPSPQLNLRPIQLIELKARGRYGAVWKAMQSSKIIAVKIFPEEDKQSWLFEKNIYSLPQMSHENLLQIIAFERRGEGLTSEYWLITAYHERGSLCDFLKSNIISWTELCQIALSMSSGLMYLHEEQPTTKCQALKPSIAHRDFKSKNVLLKSDLTACISDFGLALVFYPGQSPGDTHGQVGTRRYMAPEVLEGAINFQKDAFLRIDMYACALVLWELMSRCSAQDGLVPEYRMPYEEEVGQHPALDEMQDLVVTKRQHPVIRDTWKNHHGMLSLIATVEECWDHDAEARLSASCVVERLLVLNSSCQFSSKDIYKDSLE